LDLRSSLPSFYSLKIGSIINLDRLLKQVQILIFGLFWILSANNFNKWVDIFYIY
jgi:hypothetical protein